MVEVYVHASMGGVEIYIARRGFIATHRIVEAIAGRVQRLVTTAGANNRTVAERVGLAPVLSADWYQFLDNLLQQADSWAFLVHPTGTLTPC